MEDLIWKFIDSDCNDAEVQKVKHLLSSDVAFKALYDECVQLNDLLTDNAVVTISPTFKSKIVSKIESQLVVERQSNKNILPFWLIVSSVVAAIIALIVASLMPDQSAPLSFELPIDQKSMSIAIWSMGSFVCLVFTDFVLKRTSFLKQRIHIFS